MSKTIDQAGHVREGEALDIESLHAWLQQQSDQDLGGKPRITQYSGGASNWTYRLDYPNADYILRRPPAGTKAENAHDMGREYRIQRDLKPHFPHVPSMICYCHDPAVIGAEFYIMERLPGIIPRKNMPADVTLDRDGCRELCTNALDTLIALHRVDFRKAGLEHIGKGAGYSKRQIDGWCRRYSKARTWNVPSGSRIMSWLQDNIPDVERLCITHNDFKFDNLVLAPDDPTQILGVLDWELATIGDPLMDVGNTLALWVNADDDFVARSARMQPTHLPGMLTRQQVIDYYCQATGISADNWAFYEVYGLFRLAAIGQQIYYRYHHKQTRNPAFRKIWIMVNYLHYRCRKIINRNNGTSVFQPS